MFLVPAPSVSFDINNYVIKFFCHLLSLLRGLPCLLLVPRRTDWRSLPLQQQNLFLELAQALATVGIVTLGIWMSSQFGLLN